MPFALRLAWLLLFLTCSIKCLEICLGSTKLSRNALKYIINASPLDHDGNLISLLRLMKGGRMSSLVQDYYENCSLWSYKAFSRVKSFILNHPRSAQLLMNLQCYENLNVLVRERYSLDAPNVIKDFDEGLLAAYLNPIISSQLINKLKFSSLLEKFDPDANVHNTNYLLAPRELIEAEGGILLPRVRLYGLLLPYWYRAIEAVPDLMQSFKAQKMEQIVPLINGYAKKAYDEDGFAFFIIFATYAILSRFESNQGLFTSALRDISPALRKSTMPYVLFRSIILSHKYPYGEEHFAIRKEVGKMRLNNQMLIRYATVLVPANRTPFEACRFFFGAENIKQIQSSGALILHGDARRCLTREEWVLYLRRWFTADVNLSFIINSPNPEELITAMLDYLLKKLNHRPITINSEAGEVVFERSILFLINEINNGGEIIKFQVTEPSHNQTISFPTSIIHNDLYKSRILDLLMLIALRNLYFDLSWSLEEGILEDFYALYMTDFFQEEQAKALNTFFWLLNVNARYPEEATKLAKQIRWDSDD